MKRWFVVLSLVAVEAACGGARTASIVMRSKSGTIRHIVATHRWDKLMQFSEIKFD